MGRVLVALDPVLGVSARDLALSWERDAQAYAAIDAAEEPAES
jgi:hypothetical protein